MVPVPPHALPVCPDAGFMTGMSCTTKPCIVAQQAAHLNGKSTCCVKRREVPGFWLCSGSRYTLQHRHSEDFEPCSGPRIQPARHTSVSMQLTAATASAGLIQPTLLGDGQVRVDMGPPTLAAADVPTTLEPTRPDGSVVAQVRAHGMAFTAVAGVAADGLKAVVRVRIRVPMLESCVW